MKNNFNRIIFYNHYHNGDLHVSRTFISKIIANIHDKNIKIDYTHNNDKNILNDLNIGYVPSLVDKIKSNYRDILIDKTLYINTWYGADKKSYLRKHRITFDCLYFLFDDICKDRFNFQLSDLGTPESFLPIIDYSFFERKNIDLFLSKFKNQKKILFCNCKGRSGQGEYFDMIPVANLLARKYPDILFLVTNEEENQHVDNLKNIFLTPHIIKKNGSDLNENSYISTFCDMIVGRASGPYTFSFVNYNLFRETTFLSYVYNIPRNYTWLGDIMKDKIFYTSNMVNCPKKDFSEVQIFADNVIGTLK